MPNSRSSSVVSGLVRALIEHNPGMRLGELLSDPAIGNHVRSMTVGELFGGVVDSGAPRRGFAQRKSIAVAKTAGVKPRGGRADTRTAAGRADYDAKVLGAIVNAKGEPVSAGQVRSQVGGDPLQFRAAADRLVRAKKVKVEGKARGTRYRAR